MTSQQPIPRLGLRLRLLALVISSEGNADHIVATQKLPHDFLLLSNRLLSLPLACTINGLHFHRMGYPLGSMNDMLHPVQEIQTNNHLLLPTC